MVVANGMRTRAMAAGEKRRKLGDGELRLVQITTEEQESVESLRYTRTSKPRSEIKAGLRKMITPSPVISSGRTLPAEKLPPSSELEEFFASAEKELHRRFKDKYNYDIVNDIPLEGRFEWVELQPKP